ncbi:MAG: hypothetical protein ACLTW1_18775 [[Clostridium] innocuum]
MAICSRCNKTFDESFDRDTFEMETLKNYDNLEQTLCADCAIEAIRASEDGIYHEVCERCGRTFDPIVDESIFLSEHSEDYGADFTMFGEILCADCANSAYEELPT